MTNFFRGIMTGAAGFVLWVGLSVIAAVDEFEPGVAHSGAPWYVVVAFAVMVLGPVLFWFVVPAAGIWGRRRRNRVSP